MNTNQEQHFSFRQHPEGRAILISLSVGVFIVIVKVLAYLYSGSIAIMADMLESLVHNFAVGLAAYCLWFSNLPADQRHLYGHGKSQFISSGVEGGLVSFTGLIVIFNSIRALITGHELEQVATGSYLATLAAIINSMLVWYLLRIAKQERSIVIRANAMHVLSDVVTTVFAIIGAVLAWWSGLIWLDALVALIGGIYIGREGFHLIRESMSGLLDEAHPEVDQKLRDVLNRECQEHDWTYHQLRHRFEGKRIWMELHLVLNPNISLKKAHDNATHLEKEIKEAFDEEIEIITHLEPNSAYREQLKENEKKVKFYGNQDETLYRTPFG